MLFFILKVIAEFAFGAFHSALLTQKFFLKKEIKFAQKKSTNLAIKL